MKLYVSLLVMSLGAVLTSGCPNECTLSDLLSLSNLMKSMAATVLENAKITCTDVLQKGATATCPADSTPTGCACGMGCGSWDIRSQTTCHCQCANIDWTSARCCKVGAK